MELDPTAGEELAEELLKDEEFARGLDRRSLLLGTGAVGLGGVVVLGTGAGSALAAPRRSSAKKLRVVWTTHSIADWNAPVETGFVDAARQLGLTYQKTGVIGDFSIEKMVDAQLKTIQTKPDIWVTTWTDPNAFLAPIKKALSAGITVIINNTNQTDTKGNVLGLPYVGQSDFQAGIKLATVVCQFGFDKGIKKGTIPNGNPEPGHSALETRTKGIQTGISEFNKAHGTSYKLDSFPDESKDPLKGVSIWKTKLRQSGKNLAGITTVGFSSIVAALKAMQELNMKPGQVGVGSYDTGDIMNKGVKDGYVQILIDQQLYSQGYVSTFLGWQERVRGFYAPSFFNTGERGIVTKDNIDKIIARDARVLQLAKQYRLIK